MPSTVWFVEKSWEATTLDYLSPLWYTLDSFSAEPGFEAEAQEAAEQRAAELREAAKGGDPVFIRATSIAVLSDAERYAQEDADAAFSRQYWADRAAAARAVEESRQALFALKGQTVVVTRGRKVPVGTEGVVFWIGEDKYSRTGGYRVGLKTESGETHWTAASNIEAKEGALV